MKNSQIASAEKMQLKNTKFDFKAGDTVKVSVIIIEGKKERIQNFEGVCIKRQGKGINETVTVRKISGGIGVERVFNLHSPMIAGITVLAIGKVRRAKIYYLRNLVGKKAKIKSRKVVEKK